MKIGFKEIVLDPVGHQLPYAEIPQTEAVAHGQTQLTGAAHIGINAAGITAADDVASRTIGQCHHGAAVGNRSVGLGTEGEFRAGGGFEVIAIGDFAFHRHTDIIDVSFGKTFKNIGLDAVFRGDGCR